MSINAMEGLACFWHASDFKSQEIMRERSEHSLLQTTDGTKQNKFQFSRHLHFRFVILFS